MYLLYLGDLHTVALLVFLVYRNASELPKTYEQHLRSLSDYGYAVLPHPSLRLTPVNGLTKAR